MSGLAARHLMYGKTSLLTSHPRTSLPRRQLAPLYGSEDDSPVENPKKRSRSGTAASTRSSSPDTPVSPRKGVNRRSSSPSKKRRIEPAGDDSPISTPPASEGPEGGFESREASVEAIEVQSSGIDSSTPTPPPDDGKEPGQGHGKHPVQSSKGVANQRTGPEEAIEEAKEASEEGDKHTEQVAPKPEIAEPGADIKLAAGGVSIDPVEQENMTKEVRTAM